MIKGKSSLDEVQYSTTSLEDAVNLYCSLRSTEAITYEDGKASDDLTLADEKAYIEFNVADGQYQVSLKKDGETDYSWYKLQEGKTQMWFAVPGGETYATRLKNKTLPTESGKVYTLKSADVMDLGPDFTVLWKTTNETEDPTSTYSGSNSRYAGAAYYDWTDATTKWKSADAKGFRLPSKDEGLDLIALWVSKAKNLDNAKGVVNLFNEYGSVSLP